jgi:hypothetical protein
MKKVIQCVAVILFAASLTGCTINVGSGPSEKMSADEQDFFACQTWIDAIEGGQEDPNTLSDGSEEEDLQRNIDVLTRHIDSLKDVDSLTALQVRSQLETMLEFQSAYLERGQWPQDLADKLVNNRQPADKCDELVGWTYEFEVPSN